MAPMHWGKYYAFPPSLTYLSYLNQTKGPLDHYLDCDCRDTSQKSLAKRASAVFSVCPTAFWSMSLLMGSVGFLMFGLPLCFQNVALAMWKNKQDNRNLDIQSRSSACSWPVKKQRRPGANGIERWESLWLWSGQYLYVFLTPSTIPTLTTQPNTWLCVQTKVCPNLIQQIVSKLHVYTELFVLAWSSVAHLKLNGSLQAKC